MNTKCITKLGVDDEDDPKGLGLRAPTPVAAVPNVWLVNVTFKEKMIDFI